MATAITKPRRKTPVRRPASRRPEFNPESLHRWIVLILSVIALVGMGINALFSHWKRQQDADNTANAVKIAKAETDKKITETEKKIADTILPVTERLTKVEAKTDGINENGTAYGKNQYSAVNQERQQTRKDVNELQDNMRELTPLVTEIRTNVRWLMANAGAPDAVSAAQATPRPRLRNLNPRIARP